MEQVGRTFILVRMRNYAAPVFIVGYFAMTTALLTSQKPLSSGDQHSTVHTTGRRSFTHFPQPIPVHCVTTIPITSTTAHPRATEDRITSGAAGCSLCPLADKNDAICLEREDIRISFSETGNYSVLVDSTFRNEGPTAKIAMGVPEADTAPTERIVRVRIEIDGHPTKFHRKVLDLHAFAPEPNALWLSHISFRQGQSRRIRMRYESVVGGGCAEGMYFYFADGQWRGRVGERSLTLVDLSKQGDATFFPDLNGPEDPIRNMMHMRHIGRRYIQTWRHSSGFDTLCVTV